MPELPDVAVFQKRINGTSLRQRIETVEVRDAGVLKGVSRKQLAEALRGREFRTTRRHGKQLFIGTDRKQTWLTMHFGMTGRPEYVDKADEPQHTRVLFRFKNGKCLAYVCMRKLGRVGLTDGPEGFIRDAGLGPDALDDLDRFERFREALAGRSGSIKATLMSQDVLAGIGNVYSNEILFQSRVHPEAKVGDLDEKRLRQIHRSMQRVLTMAIDREVEKFPRTWLLPNVHGECPRCGTPIKRETVAGRSAYFCPRCQKKR